MRKVISSMQKRLSKTKSVLSKGNSGSSQLFSPQKKINIGSNRNKPLSNTIDISTPEVDLDSSDFS
jgi:hypothetical protein